MRALPVLVCVGLLVACNSGRSDFRNADISRVAEVQSSFAPPFTVTTVGPVAIDPRILGPQTLPPGLTFDPADCGKAATEQTFPPGVKGNMAATTAEGDGVRYIVIAVETSQPVPFTPPADNCKNVNVSGAGLRGDLHVVEAPKIDGVDTFGTYRALHTDTPQGPRTGELYSYRANFGNFVVIVTANPLVIPDKPVALVDTQRARDLLAKGVELVKG